MSILRTETRITGPSSGGEMLSVQHWAGTETQDPGELAQQAQEARDRLAAAWAAWQVQMVDGATVYPAETVIVVDLDPPQIVPMSAPTPIVGSRNEQALPWATQGVITLRDGSASRSGRGRIFLPYATQFGAGDGVPNASAIGSMTDFADALGQPQGVTPLTLGIYHRKTGTITSVGTAQPRNYWAYLGSRRD